MFAGEIASFLDLDIDVVPALCDQHRDLDRRQHVADVRIAEQSFEDERGTGTGRRTQERGDAPGGSAASAAWDGYASRDVLVGHLLRPPQAIDVVEIGIPAVRRPAPRVVRAARYRGPRYRAARTRRPATAGQRRTPAQRLAPSSKPNSAARSTAAASIDRPDVVHLRLERRRRAVVRSDPTGRCRGDRRR